MPLLSCGSKPLASSFLTGDGSHMVLWTSVVLHVIALALNVTANSVFISNYDAQGVLLGWALSSLIMHSLAVVGTVVVTGFFKDPMAHPLINTAGLGLFLCALVATEQISYAQHYEPLLVNGTKVDGTKVDSAENVGFDVLTSTPKSTFRDTSNSPTPFLYPNRSPIIFLFSSNSSRWRPSLPTR